MTNASVVPYYFKNGFYTSVVCCCSVAKSSLTLCNPLDGSPPNSSVHGISQARILELLQFPSPGHLPDPEIEPAFPSLEGRFFTTDPRRKHQSTASELKKKKKKEGNCTYIYQLIYSCFYIMISFKKQKNFRNKIGIDRGTVEFCQVCVFKAQPVKLKLRALLCSLPRSAHKSKLDVVLLSPSSRVIVLLCHCPPVSPSSCVLVLPCHCPPVSPSSCGTVFPCHHPHVS